MDERRDREPSPLRSIVADEERHAILVVEVESRRRRLLARRRRRVETLESTPFGIT